jgi:hypothetical protein
MQSVASVATGCINQRILIAALLCFISGTDERGLETGAGLDLVGVLVARLHALV